MPLVKSPSKEAFKTNVAEMIRAGHPRDQSLAAAYRVKRGKANGGLVAGFAQGGPPKMSINPPYYARAEARGMMHSGPINSVVPGRTDRHNVTVGSGSYIIPSDTVSHLGQNNTAAGHAILSKMFSGGPYGSSTMKMAHGAGPPRPPRARAAGGVNENEGKPVPIVVAGGEYTVPENVVKAIGGGDIAHGHKVLDAFVLSIRKKHIATLRKLPPPAKS